MSHTLQDWTFDILFSVRAMYYDGHHMSTDNAMDRN
eukprot:CAMPEP_0202704062 /NCGR_PEP_ID=MMETSP1385-20130828/16822_1 /ASSEMBLY_ACC=CAM_ASM_000861 /TAXON_ID=933848 /ORGANISM="Elphidium margaritaceum" /LENGTH=35 /DNA_ID= /DNA_START= /DNA_END= /DNA_ORIENTATION=